MLTVGDHQVIRLESTLDAVECAQLLPGFGPSHDDLAAGQLLVVECVQGVAERKHDVVRDVDDVRDRPHSRGEQPGPQPDRRRPDRRSAEEPPDVSRTRFEVLDRDFNGLVGVPLWIGARRRCELQLVERSHLARDPVDGQQIRPVVARLQLEDRIGERQDVREQRSRLEPVRQEHDPAVIGAELDLVLRKDHSVAELPANLALFELQTAWEHCAGQRDADRCARSEVPRSADDLPRVALAQVDLADLQPVRVRVLHGIEHAADTEEPEVAVDVCDADRLDLVELARRDDEAVRELGDRHLDRDVLPQPADRDLQNCLRTRRSFSQNMRMSGMP